LEVKISKKELQRLTLEANEVSASVAFNLTIVSIDDSMTNPFEKKGNDTIHTRVEQSNLVFGLIFFNV
jgi:hypothetical protein